MPTGVQLPDVDGQRSSSAFGRAVVADALRAADPEAARAALSTKDWRSGYLPHFRHLIEIGQPSYEAALTSARDGLAGLHERMRYDGAEGERPLIGALAGGTELETVDVKGEGDRETELSLPFRGERLRGDALRRQLDRWVEVGSLEPSCAEAVRLVLDNPDWLDLSDRQVVVLGAGAEMGPLQAMLRWGGNLVGVDLPRPDLWTRVLGVARAGAGRLTVPVRTAGGELEDSAGVDLLTQLPDVAAWLGGLAGPLVLGNYVYADGVTNLRVSAAVDALTVDLLGHRTDVALSFLATPTDVFAVPVEVVEAARAGHGKRSALRAMRLPLRAVSGGRLLVPNYPGDEPVCDSLVPQQGPNYALAKRLQRWRAAVARDAGVDVSLNVAPPTRTRSVVKNRLLATAYAGARRFGVEVFEPATSNVLMAALLVHDLRTTAPERIHPFAAEAAAAAHGGLWRQPYSPRSVLGLAVLVGVGGSRT
ncbi:MAG: uncharacterized protein JWP11_2485 [Frankiales bacterium]|nr:uncharacterized protein [Frankiales bacterium]